MIQVQDLALGYRASNLTLPVLEEPSVLRGGGLLNRLEEQPIQSREEISPEGVMSEQGPKG